MSGKETEDTHGRFTYTWNSTTGLILQTWVNITEDNGYNEQTIQVYTDGGKSEHGVGSGVAIFVSNELKARHNPELQMLQQPSRATSYCQGAGNNTRYRHRGKYTPHDRHIYRQQNHH